MMLLPTTVLFELAVYRTDEDSYYREFEEYRIKNINIHTPERSPIHLVRFKGQWEYNEIVGFLKFYVSGKTQIRVEYSETNSKRKVKTRTKIFVAQNDSFCTMPLTNKSSDPEILEVIESCIEHCRERLKNRYIDIRLFESTYKHIPWHKVIA
jgi:hypothetical protein